MKKKFKIEVDCANCAAKMEEAVRKIDGVKDVSVSFMTQKMAVEADETRFDEIMQMARKACKKVEPDCEIYL
ncbi:MAG: cation transporter [Clostridia bacterium]|nr:cation transporter [Clostridia bacterium]